MRYKVLYVLFAISAVLYANLRLPMGLTPRHIMTVAMLIVCISEDRRIFMDKWFGVYLIFIAGFALSSGMTGYFSRFPRLLVGFYFVAFIGYWATHILVKKYDGTRLFVNLFIIIGLIDAVVTIGQFFNIPYLTMITGYMGINVDADFLDLMDEGDEAFGYTLPGVLSGGDVYNGYFIGIVGTLSLYYLKDGIKIIRLIPLFVFLTASFMVQQRGPFYILLLFSVFMLFKASIVGKKGFKYIFIVGLFLILPVGFRLLFSFLMQGDSRFNIGLDSTNRDRIYIRAFEFIQNNFIWGGRFKLRVTEGFAPHNLFLNAWIDGGFVGFLAILWLTIKQCVAVIRLVFHKLDSKQFDFIVCGLAFLGFTLNSMLHNASIVTGDMIIWMLWGVFWTNVELGRSQNKVIPT